MRRRRVTGSPVSRRTCGAALAPPLDPPDRHDRRLLEGARQGQTRRKPGTQSYEATAPSHDVPRQSSRRTILSQEVPDESLSDGDDTVAVRPRRVIGDLYVRTARLAR